MQTVAVKEVVQALVTLPPEQIATVYDFILFLQGRHVLQGVDVADVWTEEDVNDLLAASLQHAAETLLVDEADYG
jgi:hypothetical protein